jgi:hypothetical protein
MNKQSEDIKVIREMMEKSSKFLSLSGLSGVIAGVTATVGAAFAYFYLLRDPSQTDYNHRQEMLILLADAVIVLFISLSFGIYFSWKKAKKNHQALFNSLSKRIVYNMAIPLVSGGIFSLALLLRADVGVSLVSSATLLFYGLALVNVSKYTFDEVHHLGIIEILLGLLGLIFTHNGILFWTIGFGLCHIIYGVVMYKKYDKKEK